MPADKKKITIDVELDENNFPEKLEWNATDEPSDKETDIRAMMLALWDHHQKDTLRLDLWTKKMTRDEMKIFFHQTLLTMADSLEKSIDDERISGDMRDFCAHFAEKMNIGGSNSSDSTAGG